MVIAWAHLIAIILGLLTGVFCADKLGVVAFGFAFSFCTFIWVIRDAQKRSVVVRKWLECFVVFIPIIGTTLYFIKSRSLWFFLPLIVFILLCVSVDLLFGIGFLFGNQARCLVVKLCR